ERLFAAFISVAFPAPTSTDSVPDTGPFAKTLPPAVRRVVPAARRAPPPLVPPELPPVPPVALKPNAVGPLYAWSPDVATNVPAMLRVVAESLLSDPIGV